jgi:hypothetical protein
MLVHARRYAFIPLAAFLVSACSGAGTPTPSAPAQSDVATAAGQDATALSTRTALAALDSAPDVGNVGRFAFKPLGIRPDAKSLPFLMDFVTSGAAQSGVPCISCVSGAASGDNIGLTGPQNYVPSSATWQYSLAYTNISFTGKCKLAWSIGAGKKVVDAFSTTVTLAQAGGYVLYGLDRNRPKYSGPAVLTGRVTCGKGPAQTAQAPMYFQ